MGAVGSGRRLQGDDYLCRNRHAAGRVGDLGEGGGGRRGQEVRESGVRLMVQKAALHASRFLLKTTGARAFESSAAFVNMLFRRNWARNMLCRCEEEE